MMSDKPDLRRDGTSQARRRLVALEPDYVKVDERSLRDQLASLQRYSRELTYFTLNNRPHGDWNSLLGAASDLDDLAAFVDQWLLLRLSADILPEDNDGTANFLDYAAFADAWRATPASPNWNPDCDISPEGGDDIVDAADLLVFLQQWLQFGASYGDITPGGGDGIVDLGDYTTLADSWMQGM